MTTTPHGQVPEALRLADALERPGYGWHSTPAQCAAELRRLHAELETLRTGYEAARLEIESLRKEHADELSVAYMCGASREKELAALQVAAYAELIHDLEVIVSTTLHATIEGSRKSHERDTVRKAIEVIRACHRQASAEATLPEGWVPLVITHEGQYPEEIAYSPVHKSDKQRARDAYAAGMGDPLVTAAPAAVAGPSGYGPKVTVKRRCSDCKACNSESYAVQGDSGHYVYCEHPSLPERKYIGDTHWDTPDWCPAAAPTTQPAPQPSPTAQVDALDTMRLDWLDADESRCVFHLGKSWYTRPSYGLPYRKRASLREAINAARAAQDGKTNE